MTKYTINQVHALRIPSKDIYLDGSLYLPQNAHGLILFVHGSGSSRFSIRNQYVATMLNKVNLATLLFDLLTPEEDVIDTQTSKLRFNIELLSSRLIDVTHWCNNELATQHFSIGYFGASTGGGAALVAAAQEASVIKAVVSRGGRPDLAGECLALVKAPTLLIVGSNDEPVIRMNQDAMSQMHCVKKLEIVPGATHLFEEPGTLDTVGHLAKAWFTKYLT